MSHDDREIEFILFKESIERAIEVTNSVEVTGVNGWSCERWAVHLLERFALSKCEVSEDGENGAVVEA